MPLRIVTKDSRPRVFQYKLLNNVLYLNKMLFRFGKIDSPLCSFCKMIEETPLHLFYNCIKTKLLWDQLKDFISNKTLSFPSLAPQSAILDHIDLSDDYLLINHLILIYKFYIYNSRNRGYLNIAIGGGRLGWIFASFFFLFCFLIFNLLLIF